MEIKCDYTNKEVEKMILEAHQKNLTLPEGMEWHAETKTYGGAEVIAVKKKDKQAEQPEPQAQPEEV